MQNMESLQSFAGIISELTGCATMSLRTAEQGVLRAERAVARQDDLIAKLRHRSVSSDLTEAAERVLAVLQSNLKARQDGLRIHQRIEAGTR
jgi:hypothetical protein